MIEDELAAIEARERAATPGPIFAGPRHSCPDEDEVGGLGWDLEGVPEATLRGCFAFKADAVFYAAARADVPVLLAEIRRLRALLPVAYDEAGD